MIQWEYETVETDMKTGFWGGSSFQEKDTLNTYLNKMGILGWELVNTTTNAVAYGQTTKMLFIFKRPKQ